MSRIASKILASAAFVLLLAGCSAEVSVESPDDLYAMAGELRRTGSSLDALNFYQRAAGLGHARALLIVAHHEASNTFPASLADAAVAEPVASSREYESALAALLQLGDAGDAEALMLAGLMTFVGYGTEPDSTQGRALLVNSAELGSAEAPFWLAWTLERDHRYRDAATEYERAIAMGYAPAFVELAMLHIDGRLAGESYARGMAMLRVAHERGDTRAGELFLGLLERTERSAANGNTLAKERLREMQLTGLLEVSYVGTE